jgi:hypothetical protein
MWVQFLPGIGQQFALQYWPLVFAAFGYKLLGQIEKSLSPHLERELDTFYRRAAAVHFNALHCGACIYAAAETFVCDNAGDSYIVFAVAVLREHLELTPSRPGHRGELSTTEHDLAFDFVVVGATTHSAPLDSWLHEQSIVSYLRSDRVRSAIWDLSRLPPGSHHPDSTTFQWLRRSLVTVDTRWTALICSNYMH